MNYEDDIAEQSRIAAEEAVNASIRLLPSSSNSTLHLPQPPPPMLSEGSTSQSVLSFESVNGSGTSKCAICLDHIPVDNFFSIEGCTHKFCYPCIKQHVEVKLLNGVLPNCPHEGCKSELRVESCKKFLMPKLIDMMTQRLKEYAIPVTEKVYCPYPNCSTLMSKVEAKRVPCTYGARTCDTCHRVFCIFCKEPWHAYMTCRGYRIRNPTHFAEDIDLKNLAAKNLWRQCRKCKHVIELAVGCYHITCRCGCEFCYICGAEWKDKKPTCSCPLWDERNIIDDDGDFEEEDDYDFLEENALAE